MKLKTKALKHTQPKLTAKQGKRFDKFHKQLENLGQKFDRKVHTMRTKFDARFDKLLSKFEKFEEKVSA